MVSAPILAFPEFGREAEPFILDVDASGSGLGAVLSQKQNGQERVIAYASRLLQPAETRYPVTKRELLAATWAMRHMRCYLLGKPFVVRSDHKALEQLQNFKTRRPRSPDGCSSLRNMILRCCTDQVHVMLMQMDCREQAECLQLASPRPNS